MSTRNLFDREALIQADCLATLAAALLVVLTVVVGDD